MINNRLQLGLELVAQSQVVVVQLATVNQLPKEQNELDLQVIVNKQIGQNLFQIDLISQRIDQENPQVRLSVWLQYPNDQLGRFRPQRMSNRPHYRAIIRVILLLNDTVNAQQHRDQHVAYKIRLRYRHRVDTLRIDYIVYAL